MSFIWQQTFGIDTNIKETLPLETHVTKLNIMNDEQNKAEKKNISNRWWLRFLKKLRYQTCTFVRLFFPFLFFIYYTSILSGSREYCGFVCVCVCNRHTGKLFSSFCCLHFSSFSFSLHSILRHLKFSRMELYTTLLYLFIYSFSAFYSFLK